MTEGAGNAKIPGSSGSGSKAAAQQQEEEDDEDEPEGGGYKGELCWQRSWFNHVQETR